MFNKLDVINEIVLPAARAPAAHEHFLYFATYMSQFLAITSYMSSDNDDRYHEVMSSWS